MKKITSGMHANKHEDYYNKNTHEYFFKHEYTRIHTNAHEYFFKHEFP